MGASNIQQPQALTKQPQALIQQPLPPARKYVRPLPEDTWDSIAARELTELPADDASGVLQSWNFHVFMRPAPPEDSPRAGNPILPSDIIFLEPPVAAP